MPEPLEPRTATRSPYQTSRSNGLISPLSSRSSQTTARLPVRPPLSRIVTCCSRGCSVGGPFSSNLRSRVWAALYWLAMPSLYSALILSRSTSALILACSSSQRRRISSKRRNRSFRASWYDAKPPGCVHTRLPAAPSSTVTTRVAVLSSSSRSWLMNRIVLSDSRIRCSSQILPGTSRKLSGSSSSSTSSGPRSRNSSTSRFCSPPERVRSSRYLARSYGTPEPGDRADVPGHLEVVAAGVGVLGQRLGVLHLGLLVVGLHQRALAPVDLGGSGPDPRRRDAEQQVGDRRARRRARCRPSAASRPSPPERVTTPACGTRSPVMIRSSVVLPAPLAPTSATLAPSPTRNDTSSSSTRPSGSS